MAKAFATAFVALLLVSSARGDEDEAAGWIDVTVNGERVRAPVLSLDGTPDRVRAEDVAAFREAHPPCHVVHGWGALFAAAVAGADRVRVRSGGTCHRSPDEERTLVESE